MNSRYRGTRDSSAAAVAVSLQGQGTHSVLLWPAALAVVLDLDHKGAGPSDYDATVPCTAH